jgi:hypothetical protein
MAGDLDDRKSTTGSLSFIGGSPVTWQSHKQQVVALSSCEAEYIVASTAACQAVWLRHLLGELLNHQEEIVEIFRKNSNLEILFLVSFSNWREK